MLPHPCLSHTCVVMAPMIQMVLRGRLCQMAYEDCSHIATNLGPHRAQAQWVCNEIMPYYDNDA